MSRRNRADPREGSADETGEPGLCAARAAGEDDDERRVVRWEDLSTAWSRDSDAVLIAKLFVVSTGLSAAVKWGSLGLDFPFEPSVGLAFLMIFAPTALNVAKWNQISNDERAERETTR